MAEIRNLSIMFADLVDSTRLSTALESEEQFDLQREYHALCTEVVEKFGGFVAKSLGDGLLVYFGYPKASETDAERSIRAALEIVERLRARPFKRRNGSRIDLATRVGIHTGQVVVGSTGTRNWQHEYEITGHAPNFAARLQAAATPNSVVISEDTFKLVAANFEVQRLGPVEIKGMTQPVVMFRVVGTATSQARFEKWASYGISELVGRHEEQRRLRAHWAHAKSGNGLFVLISGDAGVGKSRLVWEFRQQADLENTAFIQLNCSELYSSTPLFPFVSALTQRCGFTSGMSGASKLETFQAAIPKGYRLSEVELSVLAELMGMTDGLARPQKLLNPIDTKRVQFQALAKALKALTRATQRLIIIEDVHWIDPSSAELLRELAPEFRTMPVLLIATTRQAEHDPALPASDDRINLVELNRIESLELARFVAGEEQAAGEQLNLVVEASEGVPLFIEQMTISLVQRGGKASARPAIEGQPAIPFSLMEMLTSRLDREPAARRIMQAAAVIGRSFDLRLLAAITSKDVSDVREAAHVLQGVSVFAHGRNAGEDLYEFRHALLQRAAYESLLSVERRQYHAKIADTLADQALFGAMPPEVLAHHFSHAEHYEKAIRAWLDAGSLAARKSANYEAINHFHRALDLLQNLPSSAELVELEMRIQVSLIGPLVAVKGFSSEEVESCCRRGLALCQLSPHSSLVFPFLYGQISWSLSIGQIEQSVKLAEQFIEVADRADYESGRVIGNRLLGMGLFAGGNSLKAREALERSLMLYVPERDEAVTFLFGQNARVSGQATLALVLFHLGEIDKALAIGAETLEIAERLRHPLSTALALTYVGGFVYGLSGDLTNLRRCALRLIEFSNEHKLSVFRGFGDAFLGWSEIKVGATADGISRIEKAVSIWKELKWRLSLPTFMALLADGYRSIGDFEKAQELCRQAKELMSFGGERWFEPEIHRIEGLVLRDGGQREEAWQAFYRGIMSAQEMGSVPFLLRIFLDIADELKSDEHSNILSQVADALTNMPFSEHSVDQQLARELLKSHWHDQVGREKGVGTVIAPKI